MPMSNPSSLMPKVWSHAMYAMYAGDAGDAGYAGDAMYAGSIQFFHKLK